MKLFSALYARLDSTTRTLEKVAALKEYFRTAPPHDAAWALSILLGRKFGRAVSHRLIREWAVEVTGYAPWLLDECLHVVGDLSETLSLLLPPPSHEDPPALHTVVEDHLQLLPSLSHAKQRPVLIALWDRLAAPERFILHKLLSGEFRVGVSRLLVIRALAELAGVEPAVMTHRLSGNWVPTADFFTALLAADTPGDALAARTDLLPYPFMLANALNRSLEEIGTPAEYFIEWKWDGIRAQMIRRGSKTSIWSRGEEMIAPTFPDLIEASAQLPEGTVLDGEILAWDEAGEIPLPFSALQKRLNRKAVALTFWPDVPLTYMVFDLLELNGEDLRAKPLAERRALATGLSLTGLLRLSTPVSAHAWEDLKPLTSTSRSRRVEGLMLKRLDAPYVPGRPVGLWWKLKVDPYTTDAVLTAAQPGRGRRAGLLTDYTFSVWNDEGQLVPICKAYSGLTDEELVEVDRFVRTNAVERYGPVYAAPPTRVYEIGFEAIQPSPRHKSGLALRFPRILRHRTDKSPQQADTLAILRNLLKRHESGGAS